MKNFLLYCILLSGFQLAAQNLNDDRAIRNPPLIKLSGGLNLATNYNSYFLTNKLNLFASGNLNLGIRKFNIPVSFSYSDRKFDFSQAYNFNQISVRPTYKWASATIGTGNFNFSPYTLNGHQFLGAGFELKPENWDVKIMYGRMVKASPLDSVAGPTFRRMGAGTKVSYRFGRQLKLGATAFYASDNKNSIPEEHQIFYGQTITPSENLVLGLDWITKPVPFLEWKGEVANSLLTSNANENPTELKIKSAAALFVDENSTSKSLNAFKTQVNFHLEKSASLIGVGYEKVDPGYKTLGGYYFVNDLETYSFHLSTNFWQQKVALFARLGTQKDDLENTKSTSQNRWMASVNSTIKPTEKLQLNLSFTNFKSFMFVKDSYQEITRIPGQPIDSLDYSQISRNFNLSLNQTLTSSETKSSALKLNLSLMKAEGRNGPVIRDETQSDILNAALWYNINQLSKDFGINGGFSFNQNKYHLGENKGLGPSLSLQKAFFNKKLSSSINSNLLFSNFNSEKLTAYNVFLIANYSPAPRQKISMNIGLVANGIGSNYTNANLGYNISF